MAPRFFSSPFLLSAVVLFSLLAATTSSTVGNGNDVGARTKIKNVESNKEVQALGRFSVAEYNRQVSSHAAPRHSGRGRLLAFARVVHAESQVVGGVKYYLKVAAEVYHSGAEKVFDAVVVVKPWLKSKELVSFAPSHI